MKIKPSFLNVDFEKGTADVRLFFSEWDDPNEMLNAIRRLISELLRNEEPVTEKPEVKKSRERKTKVRGRGYGPWVDPREDEVLATATTAAEAVAKYYEAYPHSVHTKGAIKARWYFIKDKKEIETSLKKPETDSTLPDEVVKGFDAALSAITEGVPGTEEQVHVPPSKPEPLIPNDTKVRVIRENGPRAVGAQGKVVACRGDKITVEFLDGNRHTYVPEELEIVDGIH